MIRISEKIPSEILKTKLSAYHKGKIKEIKLENFQGQWLLLIFYPADFTFICPTELEEAARLYPEFKKAKTEILSVSTDTVWVHKAWHEHSSSIKKINFPMLADPAGKICRAFGTYVEEEGISLRASFIVDPEGRIVVLEMNHNNIGRNIKELLRKLKAAQFIFENPKIGCPVNWQPGEKTLKLI